MQLKTRRFFLLAVILAICFAMFPTKWVFAASRGSMKVSPAFVEIDVSKVVEGQQVSVEYSNSSNQPIQIHLSFVPVTFAGDDAQLIFKSTQSVLSSHILPSTTLFEVKPGEIKTVVLTLTNLHLLAEADYYEALVARITHNQVATGGAAVSANITTLVLLTKRGPNDYPVFSIPEPQKVFPPVLFSLPALITIPIKNDGPTYGVPRGEIIIKDFIGRELRHAILNESSIKVFPYSTRSITATTLGTTIALPFHAGLIQTRIRDAYSAHRLGKIEKTSYYLFVDPVFVLSLATFCVIFFFYGSLHLKKAKRTNITPQ